MAVYRLSLFIFFHNLTRGKVAWEKVGIFLTFQTKSEATKRTDSSSSIDLSNHHDIKVPIWGISMQRMFEFGFVFSMTTLLLEKGNLPFWYISVIAKSHIFGSLLIVRTTFFVWEKITFGRLRISFFIEFRDWNPVNVFSVPY